MRLPIPSLASCVILATLTLTSCGPNAVPVEPPDLQTARSELTSLLFSETFDGNLSRWSVLDEGTIDGPSSWGVYAGTTRQTSNIYGGSLDAAALAKLGTQLYAGDSSWTDYAVSVRLRAHDDDDLGVIFRRQGPDDYYRFSMDKQRNYRRLVKQQNGVFTVLAEVSADYVQDQWYTVEIRAQGGDLRVLVDGVQLFSVIDPNPIPSGRIGLYCWGAEDSRFDDVTVTPLTSVLLADSFSSGMSSRWQVEDEGTTSAPSAWSGSNGVLLQTSNIWGGSLSETELPKPGTYVHAGSDRWTDYDFKVRMLSSDNDAIGVMFRYQGRDDYYRFSMDSERGYRRLVKNRGGQFTVLAESPVGYTPGQWYWVEVKAHGPVIYVYLNGTLILSATDTEPLTSGGIGLYSWGSDDVCFDDVTVTAWAYADPLVQARAACAFGAGASPSATLGDLTAARAAIQHVIVITQENRSVDHMYGKDGNGLEGTPPGYNNVVWPVTWVPYHFSDACTDDPPHGWTAMHAAYNGGDMDGFAENMGTVSLGYYTPADHPFYSWLMSTFASSDRYFSSVMGPTYPNRDYLYAGTSAGLKGNSALPSSVPTIFDSLSNASVSWGDYAQGNSYLDDALGWTGSEPWVHSYSEFLAAIDNGTLPAVSFVDSDELHSEHPSASINYGESFVRQIVWHALHSPQWPHLAIILNYDEGGGFFDHVPPPAACLADPSQSEFDRLGFRVPLAVISPYSRAGYVSHQVHSHTSVTRFIEALFNLRALTGRDANSDALLDLFDFSSPPFLTPPATVPYAKVPDCP